MTGGGLSAPASSAISLTCSSRIRGNCAAGHRLPVLPASGRCAARALRGAGDHCSMVEDAKPDVWCPTPQREGRERGRWISGYADPSPSG